MYLITPLAWSQQNEMLDAARYFMNAFSQDTQQSFTFDVIDDERTHWDYRPVERQGVIQDQMTQVQRHLAHALMNTGLGHDGMEKALRIMSLEKVLFDMEHRDIRNPGGYHFTIFGEPSLDGPWGWRVEGHHLSLNYALDKGKLVSFTPFFMGTNPADVREGPLKGMRVLSKEEDLGFQLVNSLNDDQHKIAVINEKAPGDIISDNKRQIEPFAPEGITVGQLTQGQKVLFWQLVKTYAHNLHPIIAQHEMARLQQASENELYFAWAGATHPGVGHYYRIQGPETLIEFDNTQNNANHIHTVWRSPEHDFGLDVLRDHYLKSHAQAH